MFSRRPLALGVAGALSALAASQVRAQSDDPHGTELDPVVVTANPLGSTLFQLVPPTSVIMGRELDDRRATTLGETLDGVPGVSTSNFGPNVGRPVIRGLDADRIRIMSNGLGVLDASSLSEDHNVPIDPLIIERLEVVRGPAALLYGGSAVGGVVNAIDNRIPDQPISGVTGRAEARYGTTANEKSGALVVEAGNGMLAIHADGFMRRSDDADIPGDQVSSRLRAEAAAGRANVDEALLNSHGTILNSGNHGDGGALGASLTLDHGYAGISYSSFDQNYGTVAEPGVRIDMESSRWDAAGEWRDLGGFIKSVKFKGGYTDYHHQELDDGVPATTFINKGREIYVEAAHKQIGPLTGAFGLTASNFSFSALGDEAFVPQTKTKSQGVFVFEELPLGALKLNFGGRLEQAKVSSDGGGPDDVNNPGTPRFGDAQSRNFTPRSLALGGLYTFNEHVVLATNLSHTERAPTYYELYANGQHAATGQYEVGDTGQSKERSNGIDLQLRLRSGPHSGSIGVFYTRFNNYIGLFNTGRTRGADGELNPVDVGGGVTASGEDILPEAAFQAVRATFYGFESEGKYRAYEGDGTLYVTGKADYTHAKNDDTGGALPRITPFRLGAGLDWHQGRFGTKLDVTHAFRQNRVPDGDLPTDGYTMVNLGMSYLVQVQAVSFEAFLKGTNLLNQDARLATSVLRDIAPLAGRGVMAGVRAAF